MSHTADRSVPGSVIVASQARAVRVIAFAGMTLTTMLLIAGALSGKDGLTVMVPVTAVVVLVAWHRPLLAWPTMLSVLFVVIMFVPFRRYALTEEAGFQLDVYRALTATIVLFWVLALLADPRTRRRPTNVELPMALFTVVMVLSWAVNASDIVAQGLVADIFKTTTFFASFFVLSLLSASLLTTRRQLDRMISLLVASGALVAVTAIYESRSGVNVFNTLQTYIPVLHFDAQGVPDQAARGAGQRAYASAEHPIALGAALVMLLPLAIYVYRRATARGRSGYVWLLAAGALSAGALASQSRTAVVMMIVEFFVFLWIRRAETLRLLPLLLPLLVAVHVVMPGTLGSIKSAFFPEAGSIISEQQTNVSADGSGRLVKADRALDEWAKKPLLGSGFAARRGSAAAGDKRNANILDNQWLSSLLEVGVIGVITLLWLFGRAARSALRRARNDMSDIGWLFSGLGAAMLAFVVGMLTFDAFAFIQVTLLMFIFIGLSAAALRITGNQVGRSDLQVAVEATSEARSVRGNIGLASG